MTSMETARRAAPLRRAGEATGNPLLEARKKLEEAEKLRRARSFQRAERICESILERYPDYVGALHTLGLVLADRQDYARALPHLVQAAMLNPRDWTTLTALSGVYLRLGAREMAARTLEQALVRQPDNANILATLAEIYRDNREYEAAAETYRKVIALDRSLHGALTGLANSCTHLGELAEAAAALHEALPHRPRSIGVLYSLSQLPSSLIEIDLLSLIDAAAPDTEEKREKFEIHHAFAKAAALDKAGRHEEAWRHLVEGNGRLAPRFDADYAKSAQVHEVLLEDAAAHAVIKEAPLETGRPISLFILGPSRSGKTTMERLVGALAGVRRGYENPIVENAVRHAFQTAGLPSRERIIEMPPGLDELARDYYLEELAERAGGARAFTNTMPGHVMGALRMAQVLPNARFIFVKRDPDDICLRIFMKQYRSGNSYAYDLANVRDYIAWYHRMIDAVAGRLPGRTAVIGYEEMIEDPAAALACAAALCGLDPHDAAVPELGDDRGCAKPYRAMMHGA